MKKAFDTSRNRETARTEIINRCREFTRLYQSAEERIDAARTAIKAAEEDKALLLQRVHDCMAAARVLDFDLTAEMKSMAEGVPLKAATAVEPKDTRTIRDLVLAMCIEASPKPVRAAEIRKKIEEIRGAKLHEKTVGMTLYRLSREGLVERDQWDWYYRIPSIS